MRIFKSKKLRPIYGSMICKSAGNNLVQPFVPYYAARIEPSPLAVSSIYAVTNLFGNVFQIPWGYAGDKKAKRLTLVLLGILLIASGYLLLASPLSTTFLLLLLFICIYTLGTAAVTPNFSAFLGDYLPKKHRGLLLANVWTAVGFGGFIGLTFSAVFFSQAPPTSVSIFRTVFAVGGLLLIVAALLIITVRSTPPQTKLYEGSAAEKCKKAGSDEFRKLVAIQSAYMFFMSIAWGIMPITIVSVLHATNTEIIILAMCGVAPVVVIQRFTGRLLDAVGPVKLILLSRFMFAPVPFLYGVATSIYHIIILETLLAVAVAISNIAFTAYILSITPAPIYSERLGIFNATQGTASFCGALLGGILGNYFSTLYGLVSGFLCVYIISTVGRAAVGTLYLTLKETKKYESLHTVLEQMFHLHTLHWKRKH